MTADNRTEGRDLVSIVIVAALFGAIVTPAAFYAADRLGDPDPTPVYNGTVSESEYVSTATVANTSELPNCQRDQDVSWTELDREKHLFASGTVLRVDRSVEKIAIGRIQVGEEMPVLVDEYGWPRHRAEHVCSVTLDPFEQLVTVTLRPGRYVLAMDTGELIVPAVLSVEHTADYYPGNDSVVAIGGEATNPYEWDPGVRDNVTVVYDTFNISESENVSWINGSRPDRGSSP